MQPAAAGSCCKAQRRVTLFLAGGASLVADKSTELLPAGAFEVARRGEDNPERSGGEEGREWALPSSFCGRWNSGDRHCSRVFPFLQFTSF